MAPSPSQMVRRNIAKRQDLTGTTTTTQTRPTNTSTDTDSDTTTTPTTTPPTRPPTRPPTTAPSQSTGGSDGLLPDVIGGVTSAIGDLTSAVGGIGSSILPPTTTSTPTTTRTPPPTLNPTTPPVPTSDPDSSTETFLTTSGGQVVTVTAIVAITSSSDEAAATAKSPPKSFLQNKPLSGTVFALCGVVGLAIIISIVTMAIRKSKRRRYDRELDEALSTSNNDFGYNEKPHGTTASSPISSRRGSEHGSDDGLISFVGNKGHGNAAAANAYPYRDTATPAPSIAQSMAPSIPRGQTPRPMPYDDPRSFTPAPGMPPNAMAGYAPPMPPVPPMAAYNGVPPPPRNGAHSPPGMGRTTTPGPNGIMVQGGNWDGQAGYAPPMNDPYGLAPHELDYSRGR